MQVHRRVEQGTCILILTGDGYPVYGRLVRACMVSRSCLGYAATDRLNTRHETGRL